MFSSSFPFLIVCDIQTQVTQQWPGVVGAFKEGVRGFYFILFVFFQFAPFRWGTGRMSGLPRWLLGRMEDFHTHRAALLTPVFGPSTLRSSQRETQ